MGGSLIQIVCWRKERAVLWTCESGSCRSEGPHTGRWPGAWRRGDRFSSQMQNHVSAQISCKRDGSALNPAVWNERPSRPAPRKLLVDNSFVAFGRTAASLHRISNLLKQAC